MTPYSHEELRTLASAHALDALDATDAEAVQAHLASCAECRAVFDDALEAAAALALAAPSARPPADLRDRILTAARAERQDAADEVAPARPLDLASARARRRGLLAFLTPSRGLAGVFAIAAVAAAVLAISADRRANRLEDQRNALAALTRSDASVVVLRSGKNATDASVVVPRGGTPVLVSSYGSAPSDRVYQVWAIPPTANPVPQSLGIFRGGGQALIKIDRTLPAGTTIAITVEPGGGSKAPTSAPIAAAAVS